MDQWRIPLVQKLPVSFCSGDWIQVLLLGLDQKDIVGVMQRDSRLVADEAERSGRHPSPRCPPERPLCQKINFSKPAVP